MSVTPPRAGFHWTEHAFLVPLRQKPLECHPSWGPPVCTAPARHVTFALLLSRVFAASARSLRERTASAWIELPSHSLLGVFDFSVRRRPAAIFRGGGGNCYVTHPKNPSLPVASSLVCVVANQKLPRTGLPSQFRVTFPVEPFARDRFNRRIRHLGQF